MSYYTSMNVEVGARLRAEHVKNVIDAVDRHASRVELHWIAMSEEAIPRRVQPQFVVDPRLFLGLFERVLTYLAVTIHLRLHAHDAHIRIFTKN